jgi:hypothetical protein
MTPRRRRDRRRGLALLCLAAAVFVMSHQGQATTVARWATTSTHDVVADTEIVTGGWDAADATSVTWTLDGADPALVPAPVDPNAEVTLHPGDTLIGTFAVDVDLDLRGEHLRARIEHVDKDSDDLARADASLAEVLDVTADVSGDAETGFTITVTITYPAADAVENETAGVVDLGKYQVTVVQVAQETQP